MKKRMVFFSQTRAWVYLFEIPLVALFSIALRYHDRVQVVYKLFPLEIAVGAVILFLPVYFFRIALLTIDEVRTLGAFASRDRSIIKEGQTLVLTRMKKGKLRAELLAKEEGPVFEWQKNDITYKPREYCVFRAAGYGGRASLIAALELYGVPANEAKRAVEEEGFTWKSEEITLTSAKSDEGYSVRITFLKTIL